MCIKRKIICIYRYTIHVGSTRSTKRIRKYTLFYWTTETTLRINRIVLRLVWDKKTNSYIGDSVMMIKQTAHLRQVTISPPRLPYSRILYHHQSKNFSFKCWFQFHRFTEEKKHINFLQSYCFSVKRMFWLKLNHNHQNTEGSTEEKKRTNEKKTFKDTNFYLNKRKEKAKQDKCDRFNSYMCIWGSTCHNINKSGHKIFNEPWNCQRTYDARIHES